MDTNRNYWTSELRFNVNIQHWYPLHIGVPNICITDETILNILLFCIEFE